MRLLLDDALATPLQRAFVVAIEVSCARLAPPGLDHERARATGAGTPLLSVSLPHRHPEQAAVRIELREEEALVSLGGAEVNVLRTMSATSPWWLEAVEALEWILTGDYEIESGYRGERLVSVRAYRRDPSGAISEDPRLSMLTARGFLSRSPKLVERVRVSFLDPGD